MPCLSLDTAQVLSLYLIPESTTSTLLPASENSSQRLLLEGLCAPGRVLSRSALHLLPVLCAIAMPEAGSCCWKSAGHPGVTLANVKRLGRHRGHSCAQRQHCWVMSRTCSRCGCAELFDVTDQESDGVFKPCPKRCLLRGAVLGLGAERGGYEIKRKVRDVLRSY